MSAVPKWVSIRQQVLDDARYANGNAHLESPEVPQWVQENDDFMVGHLLSSLKRLSDDDSEKLDKLLTELCTQGDHMSMSRTQDALNLMRNAMTDHAVRQAQDYVDGELA